jgi:hypothetical protein
MFVPTKRHFPVCSREKGVFKKRLSESLRRRMYPNTGLHPKQLASALGKSTDTIFHWLRAENTAEGDSIDGLIDFFVSQGDANFVVEIFPGVTPLVQRNKKAERALAFVENFKDVFSGEGAAA